MASKTDSATGRLHLHCSLSDDSEHPNHSFALGFPFNGHPLLQQEIETSNLRCYSSFFMGYAQPDSIHVSIRQISYKLPHIFQRLSLELERTNTSRASFSFSEQHCILMIADVFKSSLYKFSSVFDVVNNTSAIFVVFFKLHQLCVD